jgi:DNA-binding CsgD family transcriptional regulator
MSLKGGCEIAKALFIGPRTAQGHIGTVFSKFGVATRRDAVAAALLRGWYTAADDPPQYT